MARIILNLNEQIYLDDDEIQKVIDSCDPHDRYAIEKELEKIGTEKMSQPVNIHIYSCEPFTAVANIGYPQEGWYRV